MPAAMKPASSSSALSRRTPATSKLTLISAPSTGQAEKAVAVFDKAIRLSPHDPILAKMLRWKADALEFLGRDEEASVLGNQALAVAPNDPQILRKQAATLANLGRDAEARELYQRYAALMGGKL